MRITVHSRGKKSEMKHTLWEGVKEWFLYDEEDEKEEKHCYLLDLCMFYWVDIIWLLV